MDDQKEVKRGALILFEGLDRSGKSTQANLLLNSLKDKGIAVQLIQFPDRKTEIGRLIDSYLKSKVDLSNEALHLLFSANRWERSNEIRELLLSGTTVILDRYVYSGVAYSVAKGLPYGWCIESDRGLPSPDLIIHCNIPVEEIMRRKGYGEERHDCKELLSKVSRVYDIIKSGSMISNYTAFPIWYTLDGTRSIDYIKSSVDEMTMEVLASCGDAKIATL